MCSLLSLPRELRDQIIEHVIRSHRLPPRDPTHDPEQRGGSPAGTLRIPELSPKTYNAAGLLATNAQLRDETHTRLSQLDLAYSLDVMVVGNELWPTWTCCPSRVSGPINRIDVSLRFFSKPGDPFMVHVARTFWAILQGRKWTNTSLHPLAELFLHIRDVCLESGRKDPNLVRTLCFDAHTTDRLDEVAGVESTKPLTSMELKSLFGKHRSLWNSFRSIHQYPFAGEGIPRRLQVMTSLKIMVILFLQESWEDECAIYNSYVGPLGDAFRSVESVCFLTDGQDLAQLTCYVLSP